MQTELNRLEELILDNPRIPFTRKTIVDEEQLLDQLDLVRINLPEAFEEASEILRQKEEIFLQAEEYAQDIIESAQQQADQLLDEMGIVRQAEIEAAQLRSSVQQECDELQQKTLSEIEQTRMQAMQELEQMRQMAIAECEEIQDGADEYADAVLTRIEQQLSDMLRVIRNGRQQLRGGGEEKSSVKEDNLPEVS
ncbi:MAG: ATP synthase F0 subunit B [Kamptonema sp. SIO4C4]|nr:ATP synthase F0 subunit B [Kamptonema sp. SIO4C4]